MLEAPFPFKALTGPGEASCCCSGARAEPLWGQGGAHRGPGLSWMHGGFSPSHCNPHRGGTAIVTVTHLPPAPGGVRAGEGAGRALQDGAGCAPHPLNCPNPAAVSPSPGLTCQALSLLGPHGGDCLLLNSSLKISPGTGAACPAGLVVPRGFVGQWGQTAAFPLLFMGKTSVPLRGWELSMSSSSDPPVLPGEAGAAP